MTPEIDAALTAQALTSKAALSDGDPAILMGDVDRIAGGDGVRECLLALTATAGSLVVLLARARGLSVEAVLETLTDTLVDAISEEEEE